MTWSRDLTSVSGFISPCENVSLACYYLQLDCGPVPQVTSNNKQTNIAASPEEPLLIFGCLGDGEKVGLMGVSGAAATPPPRCAVSTEHQKLNASTAISA